VGVSVSGLPGYHVAPLAVDQKMILSPGAALAHAVLAHLLLALAKTFSPVG
jgi:hypothetical protein